MRRTYGEPQSVVISNLHINNNTANYSIERVQRTKRASPKRGNQYTGKHMSVYTSKTNFRVSSSREHHT